MIKTYAKQYCLNSILLFSILLMWMIIQLFNCNNILDYIIAILTITMIVINLILNIRDYKKIKNYKLKIIDILEDFRC